MTRSRARILNKKTQCRIIYDSMSLMYAPFDPCTQIRNVVNSPFQICQAPKVDCNRDLDGLYMPASWPGGDSALSFPNFKPPHTCPKYVSIVTQACADIKAADFYARSNLDDFCDTR